MRYAKYWGSYLQVVFVVLGIGIQLLCLLISLPRLLFQNIFFFFFCSAFILTNYAVKCFSPLFYLLCQWIFKWNIKYILFNGFYMYRSTIYNLFFMRKTSPRIMNITKLKRYFCGQMENLEDSNCHSVLCPLCIRHSVNTSHNLHSWNLLATLL